ncbi:nitrate- and nitrite sensing domain-containing protein [Micromonospora sp. RHAY321]|uniref:nitrate- and nitrite sensing domain-containing protein n=1 Tax=Micromonospora sp. RHAY321 TaxID=2944807 RepID=UPI00207D2804|nr:nitrate- and nitrite sensing domain-containing protein [Micromonospora sp. RHAY321]MCO1596958.1 nitrate- and nitrite sensing domain-containing protein [Micromonospora sp. RHAY321]
MTEDRPIRIRLVALAAVLVTLWSYAAYLTGQDAADLLRVRALADTLGQPIDRLILSLQAERRLTAETIAQGERAGTALDGARQGTDRAAAEVRAFTEGTDLRLLTAGTVRDRADALVRRLNGLGAIRSRVDAEQLDGAEATDGYDQLVTVAFGVYGPEWGAYESELAADTRAVIALARARELLAREDTLVSAALAGNQISADERRRLAELVNNQRYARAEATAGLAIDGPGEQGLTMDPRFEGLLALEDRLLRTGGTDPLSGITMPDWRAAADAALGALHELVTATARSSVERATPGAAVIVARTGAVVGLGLIAVIAVLLSWAGTIRRLTGELARSGTDPDRWQPPAGPTGTALTHPGLAEDVGPVPTPGPTAAERTQDLFLRVTRRNQVLLRDQLNLLDGMQRRERAAEEADELFQLDHLTTRVRRNVEKLVTLGGATPARRWRRPVPLLDIARGAVAEVPDYHRVLIAPHWPWSLAGPAVTDVIHLLAELIENALVFSSTETTVRVAGEHRPQGCAIVVVDDGPGLDATALAEANHLLGNPPPDGPPVGPVGLYTAAVLAARCGARISLRPSKRGGTAAIVLLPAGLVTATGAVGGGRPGTGDGAATSAPAPAYPPDLDGVGATDPGGHGELPTRIRQAGPSGPHAGSAGPETVELPVARATRRHR